MRLGKTEEDDELEAWKMKGYGRWMTGQAQMREYKEGGGKKRQRKGESKKGRQDEDKNIMLL